MGLCGYVFYFKLFVKMLKIRKYLLLAYVIMIIGHVVLYIMKEESLTSFILGIFAMIGLIISVILTKKNEKRLLKYLFQ